MADSAGLLSRLAGALGAGDRDAALRCFAPAATVVVSGAHHDYASYPPAVVVDALLTAFMEIAWTPSLHRTVGGASVDEGVLTATHIGPFLGVDPSGDRVRANVRVSSSLDADGLFDTLSVWGSREAVLGQLGVAVGAAGVADTLVATARERLTTGVREYTPEEVAAFPVPPPPSGTVTPAKPGDPRPRTAPAVTLGRRPASPRTIVVWCASALALLALLVGVVQVTLKFLPGADAVAGAIAVSVVTPTARATSIATIPPIVKQTAPQGVSQLGGSTNPLSPVQILSSSTNAGLALVGPNVQFDYDSAVIGAQAQQDISALAQTIRDRNLSGSIYIHGYTDNLGSKEHGLQLSDARASAVAQALQSQLRGYPVRLVLAGFGDEDPVADNADPSKQPLNRRVMVLYKPNA